MDDLTFLENKKVLVFDLDGTIVNLTADWHTLKKVLRERYNNIYDDFCNFRSISSCLSAIVAKNDEGELLKFFDIIRTYEMKNIKETTLIEEIVYFIKHMEQFGVNKAVKLAILSLNTRQTIINSLRLARIKDNFDLIVGREDVRAWKPDPEGLLRIKNHFNVNKEDVVFLGDLKNDIKTGKNAGIDAYYIHELIDYMKQYITKKKKN